MLKRPRKFVNKAAWHIIAGNKYYFRSLLEAAYARRLEMLKNSNLILDWEHEPHTFYFQDIRRGCTNYRPDFRVIKMDGTHYWVEVKGYWDPKSLTKVKRFKKYFPDEKLILVDKKTF